MTKKIIPQQKTIKLTNFEVRGIVLLQDWTGNLGKIEMKPVSVDKMSNINIDTLNDNGFGCQRIFGGVIDIYGNYEGLKSYIESRVVGDLTQEQLDFLTDN